MQIKKIGFVVTVIGFCKKSIKFSQASTTDFWKCNEMLMSFAYEPTRIFHPISFLCTKKSANKNQILFECTDISSTVLSIKRLLRLKPIQDFTFLRCLVIVMKAVSL